MTVTLNPQYTEWASTWQKMRDCMSQDLVKSAGSPAGTRYLPMTSGQRAAYEACSTDTAAYQAYVNRAEFRAALQTIIEDSLGLAFDKEWEIVVPDGLDDFVSNSTPEGAGLQMAMRDTVAEQLEVGRDGILLDWTGGTSPTPYIVKYPAESIVNWVDFLNTDTGEREIEQVVLIEGSTVWRDGEWIDELSYRLLIVEDGEYVVYSGLSESEVDAPPESKRNEMQFGANKLAKIPFYFAGVTNYDPDVEQPPNLKAANLSLTDYVQSADHGQALFVQGQATPWGAGIGVEEQDKVTMMGATAIHLFSNENAKLEMAEVEGQGLTEMRLSREAVQAAIVECGVSLPAESSNESGRALQMRLTSKTAGLRMVVITCAKVYERMLKDLADLMGLASDDITVTPYLGFGDQIVTLADALTVWSLKSQGAPIPAEAAHAMLKLAGVPGLADFDGDSAMAATDGPSVGAIGGEE